MTHRTAYLNGSWLPEGELRISAFDLSVMQGVAAFSMTRSYRHQHFKLDAHITRLRESMRLLGIPDPLPGKFAWHDVVAQLTDKNPMPEEEEHRLLLVASPGAAQMYAEIAGVITKPWAYLATFPLRYTVAGLAHYFTDGVSLVTSPIMQIPAACIPSRAKHRSRLHFHLAQQLAAPDWALMVTSAGYIAECPGANVCAVYDDALVCLTEDALPGISQQTVADLAKELDLRVEWNQLEVSALWNADEVWLTGTPFSMLPVSRVDGRPIGLGCWPVFDQVLDRWSERVAVDIKGQMESWDSYAVQRS